MKEKLQKQKKKKKKKKAKKSQPGWHGRVWIAGDEGTFIGFGRAVLLERIKKRAKIEKRTVTGMIEYAIETYLKITRQ